MCVLSLNVKIMSRQSAVTTRKHFFAYLDHDKQDELIKTVESLLIPGKGILGCQNICKYLSLYIPDTKINNDAVNRNKFRQLLVTTKGLTNYISGFLIDEEAANQRLDDGTNFISTLRKRGFVPGMVVDKGVIHFNAEPRGFITDGIVGLSERCTKYKKSGCDFAKWRSVFLANSESMSPQGIKDNVKIISRAALKCQQAGLVPLIEIDVMPTGEHHITKTQEIFETISSEIVKSLQDHHVFLEGTILRTSLITPGHYYSETIPPRTIAQSTLEALSRTIPPAIAGIVFRGGGKSEEEATVLLNELCKQPARKPWPLTFAFGRSLQLSTLKAWNGNSKNTTNAQNELLQRAKANSEACLGKYVTGSIIGEASEFIMILKDPSFY